MLHAAFSALLSIAGGLLVAGAVGFLFWNLMKLVRYPEYGLCAGLAALLGLLAIGVRADQVLGMGIFFLLIATVFLWPAGSAWRNRRSRDRRNGTPIDRRVAAISPTHRALPILRSEQLLRRSIGHRHCRCPGLGRKGARVSSGKALNDTDYSELADFRYALRRFVAFSEAKAAEAGLTPQQHQALLAIRGVPAGSATVGYVAERLVLRPHSATGLIDRLEALGLVTRSFTEQDRRRAVLSLGSRAEDILASLSEIHWQEIERLKPVLQHMLHAFGAEHYSPPARTSAAERADKRRQPPAATATRKAKPRVKALSPRER